MIDTLVTVLIVIGILMMFFGLMIAIGSFCCPWSMLRIIARQREASTSSDAPQPVTANYARTVHPPPPSTSNSNLNQPEGSFPSYVYGTPYPPYSKREVHQDLVNPRSPSCPSGTSNLYQPVGHFPSGVYGTPHPPYSEREMHQDIVNPPPPSCPSSTINLYHSGGNFPSGVSGTPPPPYKEKETERTS